MALVPKALQVLGEELAIVWSDGAESYLPLSTVRRLCPCAGCAGERDLLGRLAKFPEKPLTKESFRTVSIVKVGGYAVQIFWADGHSDGLFPYVKLREWADHPPDLPPVNPMPLLPVR
jgi:DUF971 family protein